MANKIVKFKKWITDVVDFESVFAQEMRMQWKKKAEIENFQFKKLRQLTKYAYSNCPYYRKIFDKVGVDPEIRNLADFRKIPILSKEAIRQNLKDLLSINYDRSQLIPWSTGGSTGEPLKFFHDKIDLLYLNASNLRHLTWMGYNRFLDKTVALWGFPQKNIAPAGKLLGFLPRSYAFSLYGASNEHVMGIAKNMCAFKPDLLKGYSSYLYLFAKFIEDNSITCIHPKFIQSVSEKLYDFQRKKIEQVFGCEVFDNYSSREFSIAQECKCHSGYHISADNLLVEFLKDGEEVSDDEMGKIVITDLNKFGMPFIRYEIGDMGIPKADVCPCGRGLPLMRSIEGRTTDFIFTPLGKFISGSAVTLIFRDLNVNAYQIIQKTKESIRINIVKGPAFSQADNNHIIQNFQKYSDGMEIELNYVDHIPLTKSGKRRIIISEISPLNTCS